MAKTNKWFAVGVVALIAILGLLVYSSISSTTFGGDATTDPTLCADSTGVLTVAARSALTAGTDPSSPTITCGINGGPVSTSVTSGTTTFAVGDDLQCLVSKADYIDKAFTFTMPCGGKTLDAPLFYATSDNPGIRIKNDDGDFMTDSATGGATNQTNVATGETINLEVEFQGTNGESSGNGIWVIEFPASTNANITSVTLDGMTPVPIPSTHSLQNAGSKAVAFDISAVEGATKKSMTLAIVLGAGKDVSGGVLTDWYAEQDFIDDNKKISNGVEDSDGTAKYENTLDVDFYINAA